MRILFNGMYMQIKFDGRGNAVVSDALVYTRMKRGSRAEEKIGIIHLFLLWMRRVDWVLCKTESTEKGAKTRQEKYHMLGLFHKWMFQ